MNSRYKSTILIALQFILVGLLLVTTTTFLSSVISGALIFLAVVLVVWAIFFMQKSKLRISPIPAPDAVLITNGPYKYIRHPMYSAILLGAIGLLLIDFSWLRLCFTIGLAIVLLVKMYWEEKMLSQKFIAYQQYIKNSKRIIPFLY